MQVNCGYCKILLKIRRKLRLFQNIAKHTLVNYGYFLEIAKDIQVNFGYC